MTAIPIYEGVPEAAETRGLALTGLAISYGLVASLAAKGALSKDDMSRLFDGSLTALEGLQSAGTDDQSVQLARRLLEVMGQVAARIAPKAPEA